MKSGRKTYSLTPEQYERMYKESIDDPEGFWNRCALEHISWKEKPKTILSGDVEEGNAEWFKGALLNASYNCIDRHIEAGHGNQVAFYFEDNFGASKEITYVHLLKEVSRLANVLKKRGVRKGDCVCIYMPMIPEAVYAMLACARIGAVHSVVFAGFSSHALRSRINDAACVAVITADSSKRGEKTVLLKKNVDEILGLCPSVKTNIVVQISDDQVESGQIDIDYRTAVAGTSDVCDPEWMDAEDPLFILYTSGSTGKPKGVVHTTGGYLLYASVTHKYTFDHQEGDIYWCAADIGWITGHTYIVYGPLANRATSILYEGIPTYPDASRYWHIVDKYKVTTFYTSPTAIRMLMGQGDHFVDATSRETLSILGTVGEPINPEAWRWYHEKVGNRSCYIVDTWWQTETGGHAITPIPGTTKPKPGAAMQPFFGIKPVIVDDNGNEVDGVAEGLLLLKGSWPGQMRDIFNDHERFLDTYLRPYPGYYMTGDGAKRDEQGDIWITGRTDDTMNIAGRLLSTAEIESALVLHPGIVEAAVVAVPHTIKGWTVYAFACPAADVNVSNTIESELRELVIEHVGSFAKPEFVNIVYGLPKTRSGKIMRRILRKIAEGDTKDMGDISTLSEPEVVEQLIDTVNSKHIAVARKS